MLRSLPRSLGAHCLGGQGSEVHWNLLRNFFVKAILNYRHFLTKIYIFENCILSIKVLLCKLVQAPGLCCDWFAFSTRGGSAPMTLK